MRLLFLGTHSHGGFGKVTHELATRFLARGIDVRILAVDHRGEPITGELAGRVWPASLLGGGHGVNTWAAIDGTFFRRFNALDDWEPDAVFAIEDMGGLVNRVGPNPNPAWLSVPVYHYCPIEGDNLVPDWQVWWSVFRPIAMSTYGADQIEGLTGIRPPLVYHGVDTETFHPVSHSNPIEFGDRRITSKEQAKLAFGLDPKRNLILRSDALVTRKFYDRFLAAMVPVLEQCPDTDVLMHTTAERDEWSLISEIARIPEWAQKRIRISGLHDTFQGLPEAGVAALLNAADLYVSTTGGEGFGLNLAEAMACGVPVVATDWAADAEVVGQGGVLIPPLHDSYGEVVRFHSHFGMDWAVPDARAFVEPVVTLLQRPSRRKALGAEGRLHVRQFSWDTAADQFVSMFEEAHALAA